MLKGIAARARRGVDQLKRLGTPIAIRRYDKIHLGAGTRQIEGWANIDITGRNNLLWDLRKPLPVAPDIVLFVYSEHFIEHISRDDALRLLTNVREALMDGGILRISTPDLRVLVDYYSRGELIEMPHGGWFPKTPCQMVNEAMRSWGHTFVYDEPELVSMLAQAGFRVMQRMAHGESSHEELRGLETRPDFGDLIIEAHR